MGRQVACALLLLLGVAEAGPTRKVVVETDPPGATVYLNDKEAGPVCPATPCTIDVPVTGEANLIIEESSYAPEFATVDTSKRTSRVKVSLKKAIGFITIESPKGATVAIDDKDEGTVPAHIEVEAGGHHVVVTANNKSVFDDFVNVDVSEDIPVTPAASTGGGPPPPDGGGEVDTPPSTPNTHTKRRPYVFASGAIDIGFRKFTYDNAQPNKSGKQDLRTEDEAGQVLAGPVVEVYPTAIANVDVLPGLAVVFRYQYGVNSQSVMATGLSPGGTLSTYWSALELGVKYRWVILDQLAVEAGGGYLSDTYRYNGSPNDVNLVPDVDYQSLRIGVRAAYLAMAGQLEPYIVLESRLVIDGGSLGTRFPEGASASGLHGALGVAAHFGAIAVRLEGGLTQYSWTFKSDATMDPYIADGGSDVIKQITVAVGYTY